MLNKIVINMDGVLNSGGREKWDFAMDQIGEYFPVTQTQKCVPAEIEFGPDGIKIYFWSEKTQAEHDEFV